jgi:hypothetical protein
MGIVTTIDDVAKWAQTSICDKVSLKVPPENGKDDAGYGVSYTLATPTAYPVYMPGKERTQPPFPGPVPGLCVQLVEGKDFRQASHIKFGFLFAAWNPGTHGMDIFRPNGEGGYSQWNVEEALAYYQRRGEGWRDVWNFVDIALRELESTEIIGRGRVDREAGIEYGPITIEDSVPVLYPYWYAWLTFTLATNPIGINDDIESLL